MPKPAQKAPPKPQKFPDYLPPQKFPVSMPPQEAPISLAQQRNDIHKETLHHGAQNCKLYDPSVNKRAWEEAPKHGAMREKVHADDLYVAHDKVSPTFLHGEHKGITLAQTFIDLKTGLGERGLDKSLASLRAIIYHQHSDPPPPINLYSKFVLAKTSRTGTPMPMPRENFHAYI